MSGRSTSAGGIGFGGLLAIAFIVLKLCNVINWSWWWVLSPIWIPIAIGVIGLSVLGILALSRKANKSQEVQAIHPPKSRWMQRVEEAMAERERIKKLKGGN
jgi:hypothetical protein